MLLPYLIYTQSRKTGPMGDVHYFNFADVGGGGGWILEILVS